MNITALPAGDNESNSTITVEGFIIALAVVSVALRFYVRISSKAGLWWDDWLIFVSVVATVITAILLLVGMSMANSASSHMRERERERKKKRERERERERRSSSPFARVFCRWLTSSMRYLATAIDPNGQSVSVNTDPDYIYRPKDHLYLKLSFVSSVLYFTIVSSTQLSALMMYYRLFRVDAIFRRQLAVVGILVIIFWIGSTLANLTNCIPLEWTWHDALDNPKYCFNYNIFWMASGACEVLLDVLILALPIRAVLRLQLSTRKKITISGVFLLGGLYVAKSQALLAPSQIPMREKPSADPHPV